MENKLNKIGNVKMGAMALMVRDGKVLTGYRNYTKEKWKDISVWTVPGGRCDPGETIRETLKREVKEEVGITEFEIVDFIGEVSGVKEGDTVLLFFCTTTQDAKLMEPEKFSEWRWVPKAEYIRGGEGAEYNVGFNPAFHDLVRNYLKRMK